jgi:hypothetical protein
MDEDRASDADSNFRSLVFRACSQKDLYTSYRQMEEARIGTGI